MWIVEGVFWGCIGLVVYAWILFPFLLSLWARTKKKTEKMSTCLPSVSLIVAAANEERNIRAKIDNIMQLDYPKEKLEIIIGSDGSVDQTVALASAYPGVIVCDFKQRRGRAMVHNDTAQKATGEILVFTDAETIMAPDFLANAVRYFSDPRYGCGAGDYIFSSKKAMGETEGLYWRMEKKIRQDEFALGLLPYASGGCFLIRKALFQRIDSHSDIDNILPLVVIEKGYQNFYAADAKAYDVTIDTVHTHYQKRLRTSQQTMVDFVSRFPALAKAGKWNILFLLISHRFLRWATGFFLIGLMVSTLLKLWLSSDLIAWTFFVLQCGGYAFALYGRQAEKQGWQGSLARYAISLFSFLLAMGAFMKAIQRAIQGHRFRIYDTATGTTL